MGKSQRQLKELFWGHNIKENDFPFGKIINFMYEVWIVWTREEYLVNASKQSKGLLDVIFEIWLKDIKK